MRTITARLLLMTFTLLWVLVISELLNNAFPMFTVILSVSLYGVFIAYALEIDDKYDE